MYVFLPVGVVLLVFYAIHRWLHRQQDPDVPHLRVSTRPGATGKKDDIHTYMTDITKLYDIGYERFSRHGVHYTLDAPNGKELIVAPRFLDEIHRAPDEYLDNITPNEEATQFHHTCGPNIMQDHFHIDKPITKLTQSLGHRLPELVDEAQASMQDHVGECPEWTTKKIFPLSFPLVTRTANRLLFGKDLARNPGFLKLSIDYTGIMFGGAWMIRHYPEILKPLILAWKTGIRQAKADARSYMVPIFEERMAKKKQYEKEGRLPEWEKNKPQDSMQWVLDAAHPAEMRPDRLTLRMLHINIAAAHTSSVTYIDIMHCLSLMPDAQAMLREEIESVLIQEGGWTKQALTHMKKVDSFIVEVNRFCVISANKVRRLVRKDFTLSDGTILPKGTLLVMNHLSHNLCNDVFPDPMKFDPLRMYYKRQEPGQENMHQFVMASEHNLAFGAGKHACPGRFFAANEIKLLLVLTLMHYDFRMKGGVTLQQVFRGNWISEVRTPIDYAEVEFKSRPVPEKLQHILV